MKKYFCFNCQQQVEPYSLWKWRFCPRCKRYMTDDGEGFYLVCDKCGANLPPNAKHCLKCGHGLNGSKDVDIYSENSPLGNLFAWFSLALMLFLSVIIGIGVLYVSFYVILFAIFFGLVMFIFNLLKSWRRPY